MNKANLSLRIKNALLEQKNKMLSEATFSDPNSALHVENMSDEADLVSAHLEQNIQLELKGREQQFLKKIEITLRKIQNGTFGSCAECEEDIELNRLEAFPTTELCFHCKEQEESHSFKNVDPLQNGRLSIVRNQRIA